MLTIALGVTGLHVAEGTLSWEPGFPNCDPPDMTGFHVATRKWDSSAPQSSWNAVQLQPELCSIALSEVLDGHSWNGDYEVSALRG